MRFTLDHSAGRWRFRGPDGDPFLSIGVVHADDTNLRYPHNMGIFTARYGASRRRWLREGLVPEMTSWGFNTLGWTSEYVSGSGLATDGGAVDLGHSEGLPADDVAALGIPFTLSLRVAEIEHWNGHPAYRDPRGPAFAQWCDHLARITCRPDDPNLLGYFLVDVPCWGRHPTGAGYPPGELAAIADAYYRTATEAIRRHDPHHLILGDRYGTRHPVPDAVLDAAAPYVDVLSVQTFPGPGADRLHAALEIIGRWHVRTGRPVLIADTGNWCPTVMRPDRTGWASDQRDRGAGYAAAAEAFTARPWCLGWHWCGWLENPHRGFGLKDPWDEPYTDLTEVVRQTNLRLSTGGTPRSPTTPAAGRGG
ncbi:agarase [Mycolicibacterium smegmatis]|uniref:agarase n=1 Tax=Mycolicibacterium smegmatis TaxID=1772 RepID=UPI0013032D5F|nr:agarase [Mycolicibacterium smegmatis]